MSEYANIDGIRSCRWSDLQDDCNYHCTHESAKQYMQSNPEFCDCLCLGLVEGCEHYQPAEGAVK